MWHRRRRCQIVASGPFPRDLLASPTEPVQKRSAVGKQGAGRASYRSQGANIPRTRLSSSPSIVLWSGLAQGRQNGLNTQWPLEASRNNRRRRRPPATFSGQPAVASRAARRDSACRCVNGRKPDGRLLRGGRRRSHRRIQTPLAETASGSVLEHRPAGDLVHAGKTGRRVLGKVVPDMLNPRALPAGRIAALGAQRTSETRH
jgi:hypothetical protein